MKKEDYTIRSKQYAIVYADHICFKCKSPMIFSGFMLPPRHEELWIDEEPELDEWEVQQVSVMLFDIVSITDQALSNMRDVNPNYKVSVNGEGISHYENCCPSCSAIQSYRYLYRSGSPLYPSTIEGVLNINVKVYTSSNDWNIKCTSSYDIGAVPDEIYNGFINTIQKR